MGRHPCQSLATACVVIPFPFYLPCTYSCTCTVDPLFQHRWCPHFLYESWYSHLPRVSDRKHMLLASDGVCLEEPQTLSSLALIKLGCEGLGRVTVISLAPELNNPENVLSKSRFSPNPYGGRKIYSVLRKYMPCSFRSWDQYLIRHGDHCSGMSWVFDAKLTEG